MTMKTAHARATSELFAAATVAFNQGEPTRLHVDRAAQATGAAHRARAELMLNLMGVYEAMLTADAGPEAQAAVDVAREKANAAMAAAEAAERDLRWALKCQDVIEKEFVAIVDEWLAVVADRTKAPRR